MNWSYCYIYVVSFICFGVTYKILSYLLTGWLGAVLAKRISKLLITSFQAILGGISGTIIMYSCQEEKLKDQHWLVEFHSLVMASYEYYDILARFDYYLTQQAKNTSTKPKMFLRFIKDNQVMMLHHFLLPILLVPAILYIGPGVGHFYVGLFFLIEIYIPFASMKEFLIHMGKENTTFFLINSWLSLLLYTLFRIFLFPIMYWFYGQQINQPFFVIPFHIPYICNISSVGLLVLFVYWWQQKLLRFYTEVTKWLGGKPTKNVKCETNITYGNINSVKVKSH